MNNPAPDIEILHLHKSFGAVAVLRGLNIHIRGGEFIGLVGPNGAGKSTLIKILDGLYAPSRGEVRLAGNRVTSLSAHPQVAFIHQDLGLVDDLSVVDNLRLGERPLRQFGLLLDKRAERERGERALEMVRLSVDLDTRLGDLSPGEKTLVAVARAFARGARIIFVDECTSTLPPVDSQLVIDALSAACASGATVVMVSHKLSEVLNATRRVVLLIDGLVEADEDTANLDREALVEMMLHRGERPAEEDTTERSTGVGGVVLTADRVAAGNLRPCTFEIRSGEVLGITGLPGSGLHDLAYLAAGALRPTSGAVRLAPGCVSAMVPPHRETQGGFADQTVAMNMTISALRKWRGRLGLLRQKAERGDVTVLISRLDVRPGDADGLFGILSGGNKQKVIFGRAMLRSADLYVLCEPTRGVDVAARAAIYKVIRELRAGGAAILMVTSDFEDLQAVADRYATVGARGLEPPVDIASLDE